MESEYIALLNSQQDSKKFFEGLLHQDDRFSWIEEDYEVWKINFRNNCHKWHEISTLCER